MEPRQCQDFLSSVRTELEDHLLPFWLERVVDQTQGGFIGWMSQKGQVDPQASKGLILNARLLWTYAALYRHMDEPRCVPLAHRAYDTLLTHFWDRERGGAYWEIDPQGAVRDNSKKIYGQAFVIYALAEYAWALDHAEALQYAQALFEKIECLARDHQQGGYFEVCRADWVVAPDSRLSGKDRVASKSMNNHLHLLEAYTHLYRLWPEERVALALRDLILIFTEHIVDAQGHLRHFFDDQWHPLSTDYTFGHDIEASWLLYEAGAVLSDTTVQKTVDSLSLQMAHSVLDEGIDANGGLCYGGKDGQVTDYNKEWWPQAECVVGFLNAYHLCGSTSFETAARTVWGFIQNTIVDRDHGEWFWRVDPQGHPDPNEPKVSAWKGPYHNCRACLEILQRLQLLSGESIEPRNEFQDSRSAVT